MAGMPGLFFKTNVVKNCMYLDRKDVEHTKQMTLSCKELRITTGRYQYQATMECTYKLLLGSIVAEMQ